MDYLSLMAAIAAVIAAIYAAKTYQRMTLDDIPTLHIQEIEKQEDGTFSLILEIHPGKVSAHYDKIAVKQGKISPVADVFVKGRAIYEPVHELRPCCAFDVDVPASLAREDAERHWFVLSFKKSCVISLCNSNKRFARKPSITVRESMAMP